MTPYAESASAVRVSPLAAIGAMLFALVAVAIGIVELLGDRSNIPLSAAGYVTGSFVTAACVVAHRVLTQRAARNPWYSPRYALDRVASTALIVGLLAGAWCAFVLAIEVAK